MPFKRIPYSDLTHTEIPVGKVPWITVTSHPHLHDQKAAKLMATAEEVLALQAKALDVVTLVIELPDQKPQRIVVDRAVFDGAFTGKVQDELQNAAVSHAGRSGRPEEPRSGQTPRRAPTMVYTTPETFGLVHKAKASRREAEMVTKNLEQANRNRANQDPKQPPIDPSEIEPGGKYYWDPKS